MRKIFVSIVVIQFAVGAFAQQLQTSSLYEMQGVLHNPAMAGILQKGLIAASYRDQWSGTNNHPRTATLFGSFALPGQNIGLGGYIYTDKTGPTSRTGLQLAFAKHIPLANDAKLSFGIEARGLQYSIDISKLQESLGSDPVLAAGNNKFKFDAGFGVAYAGKKLQVGAAVSQLVQSKLGFYTGNLTRTEEGRLYRHYYLHGSYKWNPDGNTAVTPNFLMIYLPNAPVELQGGVRVEHSEIFWWGVAHRLHQGFILSAGVNIHKKFTVGYAFDIYSEPFNEFEKGSNAHEVILRYNIF